jgi:TRAP-type C4-dicarboxylate transport system permease small subunit
MRRALSAFNAGSTWLSGALLLVILASILCEVVARFAFSKSITWAFDLTSYGLLFVVFLATGRTLEKEGHVRIDFFLGYLGEHGKLRAEVAAHCLSVLFLAILLWATAHQTLDTIRTGAESPSMSAIPLRYIYWIMPVGTALLLLTALVRLVAAVTRARRAAVGALSRERR